MNFKETNEAESEYRNMDPLNYRSSAVPVSIISMFHQLTDKLYKTISKYIAVKHFWEARENNRKL